MKVLVIAPYYHPLEHPRAYRWKQIVDYWLKSGLEVCVLTADDNLERIGSYDETILKTGYSTPDKRFSTTPHADRKVRGRNWGRRFMKMWMWPDESMFWIRSAVKLGSDWLKHHPVDWVVSVSHPFSGHVVAKKLLERYPCKWMVDIGDPFIQEDAPSRNNSFLWTGRNQREERKIMEAAHQVVVTNQPLAKWYEERYTDMQRIAVIPPMASPDPGLEESQRERGTEVLKLGYFGTFYDEIRKPDVLSDAMLEWESSRRIELHLVGHIKAHHAEIIKRGLRDRDIGICQYAKSRSEVLRTMRDMDILIQVNNTTAHQLPSKWADYLTAHRPIIELGGPRTEPTFDARHIVRYRGGPLNLDQYAEMEVENYETASFQPDFVGARYLELLSQ